MTEANTFKPLAKGFWTSSAVGDLTEVLARAAGSGMEWQGIAYTTAGAKSVFAVTGSALTTRLEGKDQEIPLGTVYELRLWAVGARPDGVMARELRWLNGAGSAEVTVRTDAPVGGEADACWVRDNAYLQHGARAPFKDADTMTSVEIFTTEPEYGNTVFADELMTGRWN